MLVKEEFELDNIKKQIQLSVQDMILGLDRSGNEVTQKYRENINKITAIVIMIIFIIEDIIVQLKTWNTLEQLRTVVANFIYIDAAIIIILWVTLNILSTNWQMNKTKKEIINATENAKSLEDIQEVIGWICQCFSDYKTDRFDSNIWNKVDLLVLDRNISSYLRLINGEIVETSQLGNKLTIKMFDKDRNIQVIHLLVESKINQEVKEPMLVFQAIKLPIYSVPYNEN